MEDNEVKSSSLLLVLEFPLNESTDDTAVEALDVVKEDADLTRYSASFVIVAIFEIVTFPLEARLSFDCISFNVVLDMSGKSNANYGRVM